MAAATGLLTGLDLGTTHNFISGVYACPGCRHYNVVRQPFNPQRSASPGIYDRDTAEHYRWESEDVIWLPKFGASETFPDVPEHIASAATEATLCFSAGAYRAVGSLARAVVEATAKDNGATKGSLAERIDALHTAGLLRAFVRDAAHEVRHFGNDMAHGDFAEPTTNAEAAEALDLMKEVLTEVYQAPARVAAAQARRKEAKQKPPTTP